MAPRYENERAIFNGLSNGDQAAVMAAYYAHEVTIPEILAQYGITGIKPCNLVNAFPPVVSDDEHCPYCGTPLVQYPASRSAGKYFSHPWECPTCGHEERAACQCPGCRDRDQKAAQAEYERQRAIITAYLSHDDWPNVELSELSLLERVSLGAIARIGLSSDCEATLPWAVQPYPVFPNDDMEASVMKALLDKHIITVHPDSYHAAFSIDEHTGFVEYDRSSVSYCPHVAEGGSKERAMQSLLAPVPLTDVTSEALELWRSIVYREIVELFLYRMTAYDFRYMVGKETQSFFVDAIEKLAPGELYPVIWGAAKNAAAYSVEAKVSKRQAGNSVIMRMHGMLDRIVSGQYRKFQYARPSDCPQSLVSQYFFNSTLALCDRYWTMTPSVINHE